jgi:hypothetical protein
MASDITLSEIIDMLWVHPENSEWKPKTDMIRGSEFRRWMASDDMEVLGYAYHLLGDHRFRVEWYEGGGRTSLGKSHDVRPLVRSQLEKSRFRKH